MDGTTRVLDLETRLGFNFSRGLSREKGVRDHPVLSRLLSGLDTVNSRYVSYNTKRIRTSEGIKREAQDLFQQLGPSLWPSPTEQRPYWLFDSSERDHELFPTRLYPKDLYYSEPDDRELLWQHFYNLVRGKILRYHSNHRKNLPQAWEPSDSDCLPNSQESETPKDSDSSEWLTDHETEIDKDPDYAATTPRRKQNNKNNPLSGGGKAMKQVPAPTALMRPGNSSMGHAQTKLDSLRAEYHEESEMSPSLGRSHHTENLRPPSTLATNAPSSNQLEDTATSSHNGSTNLGKRTAPQENLGAKKSKLNNEVTAPKPSLLVCLKLTPGKLLQSTTDTCNIQRKAHPETKALQDPSHSATASLDPFKVVRGGPRNLSSATPCGSTPSTRQESQPLIHHPDSDADSAMQVVSSPASLPERSKNPSQNQTPVPRPTVHYAPAAAPFSTVSMTPREQVESLHGLEWLAEARRQTAANEFPNRSFAESGPPNPQQSSSFTDKPSPPHNSHASQEVHQEDTATSNSNDPSDCLKDVARHPTMDTRDLQSDHADDKGPDDMPAQHKEEATSNAAITRAKSPEVNDFLPKRMLHLYLQGQEESAGIVDLVKAKTHEKLFESIKNTIADDVDDSDTVVAVFISREDGGPIEGTKRQKIPIKKNGDPSIWEALVTFIAKNGADEGGLIGLVRVKKAADGKGN